MSAALLSLGKRAAACMLAIASSYLSRIDALAASLGWPHGPGAEVARWRFEDDAWRLSVGGFSKAWYPASYMARHLGHQPGTALAGITDPDEALGVCYEATVTHG